MLHAHHCAVVIGLCPYTIQCVPVIVALLAKVGASVRAKVPATLQSPQTRTHTRTHTATIEHSKHNRVQQAAVAQTTREHAEPCIAEQFPLAQFSVLLC
jgi:hypothetical protein